MPRSSTEGLICERDDLLGQMKQLVNRAESAKRDLTVAESHEFDRLERSFDTMSAEIKVARYAERASGHAPFGGDSGGIAVTERTVALSREQRMADWAALRSDRLTRDEAGEVSIGRMVQLMATGQRHSDNEAEQRALAEGTDSSGGFLTPEILGAQIIDLARAKSRVFEAGATAVPLESDKHSIARLATGAAGAWRAENAAVVTTDPTFERVTFQPKSYAIMLKLSYELAQDMTPAAAQSIDADAIKAIAAAIDLAALRGDGTGNQPTGVRSQSGVELISLGAAGATPTMANYITAVYGVRKDNFEPSAALWSARTAETYAKLVDTTGQPLNYAPDVASVPRLTTNQIPNNLTVGASTDCSEVYVGDWKELLVGFRPNIGVQVQRLGERFSDTLQIGLLFYIRADVQLGHPAAFSVLTGVRP